MIVVDTSVWIDVFRGVESPQVSRCVDLIKEGAPVALTDVILMEILRGIPSEREARLVERNMRHFPILRLESLDDYSLAAQLYRVARRAGVTVGKTVDCLIAATCVRTGAPILHADADFDRLASCTDLEVFVS